MQTNKIREQIRLLRAHTCLYDSPVRSAGETMEKLLAAYEESSILRRDFDERGRIIARTEHALNSCSAKIEQVKDYLLEIIPEIGVGDDPVGFLIASHASLRHERDTLATRIDKLKEQEERDYAEIMRLRYCLATERRKNSRNE